MNNQQLIKQIEKKITETQTSLDDWKQQITKYENTLLALIEELNKIKQQIKMNKNNQKSQGSSNNNNK